MQVRLLKEILVSIVGPQGSKIVDLLHDKKNVNEFLIAKKLNLTINQTRNILYKLADEGLVSFIRKKDSKKGGWYTYFWTLNLGKSLIKFKENISKVMAHLNNELQNRKTGRFFYCTNCDIEYSEEDALTHNYTCPECGDPLQLKDNSSEVESLQKEVLKMENLLKDIDVEVSIIGEKDQKAKDRKIKNEKKKKDKERLEKKKIRDKLKEKENKAKGIKKVSKKVKKNK
jgi:transcription initiation factor TFIIE subunit alpha